MSRVSFPIIRFCLQNERKLAIFYSLFLPRDGKYYLLLVYDRINQLDFSALVINVLLSQRAVNFNTKKSAFISSSFTKAMAFIFPYVHYEPKWECIFSFWLKWKKNRKSGWWMYSYSVIASSNSPFTEKKKFHGTEIFDTSIHQLFSLLYQKKGADVTVILRNVLYFRAVWP